VLFSPGLNAFKQVARSTLRGFHPFNIHFFCSVITAQLKGIYFNQIPAFAKMSAMPCQWLRQLGFPAVHEANGVRPLATGNTEKH
jgi:hypothetical protein